MYTYMYTYIIHIIISEIIFTDEIKKYDTRELKIQSTRSQNNYIVYPIIMGEMKKKTPGGTGHIEN